PVDAAIADRLVDARLRSTLGLPSAARQGLASAGSGARQDRQGAGGAKTAAPRTAPHQARPPQQVGVNIRKVTVPADIRNRFDTGDKSEPRQERQDATESADHDGDAGDDTADTDSEDLFDPDDVPTPDPDMGSDWLQQFLDGLGDGAPVVIGAVG